MFIYCPLHHFDHYKCNFVRLPIYSLPECLIALLYTQQGCSAMSYMAKHFLKIKSQSRCTEKAICMGYKGPPSQIQHQWPDVDQTFHSIYGLFIWLSVCRVCTLTVPHWWAMSRYNFYLSYHNISKYITIYHFHTSDQRVKPVHISYIALVLEC